MREIKLRAWDEELGMCQVLLIDFNNKEMEIVCLCGRVHIKVINIKNLMQFTGLKDKNGKEIYEGDIVKIDGGYCGDNHYEECIAEVKWSNDEACFYAHNHRDKYNIVYQDFWFQNDSEVIGNIYENKELLNV